MSTENWRDQVYRNLAVKFENEPETLSRIMFYLDEEEKAYVNQLSPVWRTLKNSMNSESMFRSYAKRLADDTKRAERDVVFRKTMGQMYNNMVEASDKKTDVEVYQGFNPRKFADKSAIERGGLIGFARALAVIPASSQQSIMTFLRNYNPNQCRALMSSADEVVSLVNKTGGDLVMVTLAAVALTYDAIKSILRWWRGEISGIRCCKLIIDSACTTAASVVGGMGGAGIGAVLGPVGMLVGGIAGGILSASAASYLSDRMTQLLFGIPKEESLENAFIYFDLKTNASNHEINTAYRRMCLRHHPDKGGTDQDFHFVQVNMAVIKASKGEL